ncbi:MAG: hypothetical protein GX933_06690 [Chloroflexi bacterium]|nr:hypothetical protein [Chloroflexota bacterium]
MKKYSILRSITTILVTAVIAATILVYFTPGEDISSIAPILRNTPQSATDGQLPTLLPNEQSRIGIIAGHWGVDSGHQCGPELNNLREVDVNLRIATIVRDNLSANGYQVDLLQEFDSALNDYVGLALLAIHTNTCEYGNGLATGFKVANIGKVAYPAEALKLNQCLIDRYSKRTELAYLGNTASSDPENFYNYSTLNDYTTAALIEVGYLNLDYRTLTEDTEQVARGITDGILCYLRNESATVASVYQDSDAGLNKQPAQKRYVLPGIEGLTP